MRLRVTRSGFIYITKGDDLLAVADVLSRMPEAGECCVSDCFESGFVADLCAAGFLVMSSRLDNGGVLLCPKYHDVRSALFFENLHIGKSVRRDLPRYELRFDQDFDAIVDKCVATYGDGWLTEPLLALIREMRHIGSSVKPAAFGVYRNGELKAGEFGVIAGRVYTSYSGYHEESSAGRVQMILTAQHLKQNGFAFWDLGMPLPYKYTLGAIDIDAQEWTKRFRASQ
ncbi:MAG: GNAT family N-acetyltransferase [Spirochaetaceae bacterium]|jgi:Leu/Phe-tRNA-protein transferase|nr:GNAT family N-acetyltransferase [Spirochaetaceae bacterium]